MYIVERVIESILSNLEECFDFSIRGIESQSLIF